MQFYELKVQFFDLFAEHVLTFLVFLDVSLHVLHLSFVVHVYAFATLLELLDKTLQIIATFLEHLVLICQLHVVYAKVLIVEHELVDALCVEIALI